MAISDYVLKEIYENIKDDVLESRIDKILKISDKDVGFIIYSKGKSKTLLLSLNPTLPLCLLGDDLVEFIQESNSFFQVLKKYIEHGSIVNFEKRENDRIFIFEVKKRLPTYVTIKTKLVFEMIPMRANLILLDENNKIIDAYHKSDDLTFNHAIIKGLTYDFEDTYEKNIELTDSLDSIKRKVSRKEFKYLSALNENEYRNSLNMMRDSSVYYVSENDISFLPLLESKAMHFPELFKEMLFQKEKIGRRKHYHEIIQFIDKKVTQLRKKLLNLNNDIQKCQDFEIYKDYGNLLYMGSSLYKKGDQNIVIEGINIPLLKDKDLLENAKEYFKKYKKCKSGIIQLEIQINKAKDELSYFEELQKQCEFIQEDSYKDIIEQLKKDNYIKDKSKNVKKQKSEKKVFSPHIIRINDTKIGYGLSSFQNDYLTFTLAHKEDYFLHVKDSHGPHVIIFSSSPTDEEKLLAAEIALYFASLTIGEVYITMRKNVKKIPAKTGMVELNSYQTIYLNNIRTETIDMLKKHL